MKPAGAIWVEGIAAPIDETNIDTGTIFPSRFLKKPRGSGYQYDLFRDRRFNASGQERSEFALNFHPYRKAQILVAGDNFGCGSSRENAVFALLDYGIRCVIAPSFGEIFYFNCLRFRLLPAAVQASDLKRIIELLQSEPGTCLKVDLGMLSIACRGDTVCSFNINPAHKRRLMEKLDELQRARTHLQEIVRFEAAYLDEFPWLRH